MPAEKSGNNNRRESPFPSAHQDARRAKEKLAEGTPQTRSPSYALAFQDPDFLLRDELRPVRLQLELLKPELILREHRIESTIVVFGSARLPDPESAGARLAAAHAAAKERPDDPILTARLRVAERAKDNSRYYAEARRLCRLVSERCQGAQKNIMVITTGGGGGIMEAANRGAHDLGAKSVGLNIVLPFEQAPNTYIPPELCFQFHYFALRKMHFLMRAKGLVVFPGGYGTLDELFDALTLIQTKKIKPIPVILFGRQYWERVLSLPTLVEEGMISPEDADIVTYVDTAEAAWEILAAAAGIDPVLGVHAEKEEEREPRG